MGNLAQFALLWFARLQKPEFWGLEQPITRTSNAKAAALFVTTRSSKSKMS